jgi:hypothetical protein
MCAIVVLARLFTYEDNPVRVFDVDGIRAAEAANILGWGRTSLMAELRRRKILQANNLPYTAWLDYFKVLPRTRVTPGGAVVSYTCTEVLPSGLASLQGLLMGDSPSKTASLVHIKCQDLTLDRA